MNMMFFKNHRHVILPGPQDLIQTLQVVGELQEVEQKHGAARAGGVETSRHSVPKLNTEC